MVDPQLDGLPPAAEVEVHAVGPAKVQYESASHAAWIPAFSTSFVSCGEVPQAYELVIWAYPVITTGMVAYPALVAEVRRAERAAAMSV